MNVVKLPLFPSRFGKHVQCPMLACGCTNKLHAQPPWAKELNQQHQANE
jgi:hypothetical protein